MSGHYVFNASAIGFGGVLTSPRRKVIPSLASVALAPTGGEGVGLVTNYNDGDGITFDRAETRVFGSANGKGDFATRADVLVNNLVVFNQLRIESMWATVTSIRHVEVNEDDETFTVTDKKFTFQAEYLGVRINGEPLDIPVDTKVFDDNPSYDGFVKAICADDMADYRKLIGLGEKQKDALVHSPRSGDDVDPRMISCTAVSTKCQSGFHVPVKGVGRAHLAEVLVKHGRRRLTLLRLDFAPDALDIRSDGRMLLGKGDGPDNGSATVGSVEGNGTYTLP
jgi:hypothetical protein